MAWEDPRFRSKKARPKAIKLNKFGEAPCDIRTVVQPRRVPSAGVSGLGQTLAGRPPSARVPPIPGTAACRPGTARPTSPQARAPPLAPRTGTFAAPKQVGLSWRMHQGGSLRPPTTSTRGLRAPTAWGAACPPAPAVCPPAPAACPPAPAACPPAPAVCPPAPCPRPQSGLPRRLSASTPASLLPQRSLRIPGISGISSIAARSRETTAGATAVKSKCQKIVLLPGDINPGETTVISVEPPPKKKEKSSVRFVKTRSIKPDWVGPCPEPEPEPEPAQPRSEALSFQFSPARRRLRPPGRIAGRCPPPEPCAYTSPTRRASPCEDRPPDPCPQASVIDLEPEVEDCAPPEELCPPPPCPDDAWFDAMLQGSRPSSPQQFVPQYGDNLLDITPPHGEMRGFELQTEYPEDLIQWDDDQDPFSPPPPRPSTPPPQCIDFEGKQDPFSPPKLSEYYARRYNLPQFTEQHPLWTAPECPRVSPCPAQDPCPSRRKSPVIVDREIVAKSVPHNKRVSTICQDDSDEDFGLLPEGDVNPEIDFDQPLTDARNQQRASRKLFQSANFDQAEYIKSLRGKMEQLRLASEAECPPTHVSPNSTQFQEGYGAARRVLEKYNQYYNPQEIPPCAEEVEEDLAGLDEMTMIGDVDFEAIDALDCD